MNNFNRKINYGELPVFSVAEFNEYINGLVSCDPVIVEGEISNYKRIPGRNFCYFDIKDGEAVAKCFQGFWHCKAETQNGHKVKVFGFPNLQKNGSLVIDIRGIELSGKGPLMEAYLKLKAKLETEGVFDVSHKKPLPFFPKKIGLIAGQNSSAYHDVTAELCERWRGLEIIFHPSKVQGIYAEREVSQAIRRFNQQFPVDVLIIARGGGSLEELQAFNSELVVREIFASRIPVISAIGHEDHWTLSDFVADVRAKTPTKAAEIAVPNRKEIIDQLGSRRQRIEMLLEAKMARERERISRYAKNLNWSLERFAQFQKSRYLMQFEKMKNLMERSLERKMNFINNFSVKIKLLNPQNILEKGFAIIEKDGKKVMNIDELSGGDKIVGTLQGGQFGATIEKKLIFDK